MGSLRLTLVSFVLLDFSNKKKIMTEAAAAAPKAKKAAKPKKPAAHPPSSAMVKAAIKALADKKGSSLAAIKKYVAANYKVDIVKIAPHIRKALKKGVEAKTLIQVKGSYKVAKEEKVKKPKVKKPKAKKPKAKKPPNLPRRRLPPSPRRLPPSPPKKLRLPRKQPNPQRNLLLKRPQQRRLPPNPRKLPQRRPRSKCLTWLTTSNDYFMLIIGKPALFRATNFPIRILKMLFVTLK